MNDDQAGKLIEELKWLRAAVVNNTVKQVEVECVRKMGRALTADEKTLIHKDCLQEMAELRYLLDKYKDF